MNRCLFKGLVVVTSALGMVAVLAEASSPAIAQSLSPDIRAALAYPTSSQRFFEEGLVRLETEIQHLQQPPSQNPELTINPDITESRERVQSEPEEWLEQRERGDRFTPPTTNPSR